MLSRNRSGLAKGMICSVFVVGMSLIALPGGAHATPLATARIGVAAPQGTVTEARVTVNIHTHGRRYRHGRHWRCWWHRGRRICGWRW